MAAVDPKQNSLRLRLKQKGIDSVEKVQALTLEDCEAVTSLLAAKATPQEVNEYLAMAVQDRRERGAGRSEGGFLGFGDSRSVNPRSS